jgi:pSer/pThr/pTyr-binding forkhead associated (FHA) protein
MPVLIVERGGRRESLSFPGETITIGRAEDNDLRISSRFVSQHHCRVEAGVDGARLVDLDSQNGTLVNGRDVSKCRLKAADKI